MEIAREVVVAAFAIGFIVGGVTVTFSGTSLSGELTREGSDPVVLFKTQPDSEFERTLAFYLPSRNESVACTISRRDEVQISRSTFKYVNSTDCTIVKGDLASQWDDPQFRNINIYERGQELLKNQSSE